MSPFVNDPDFVLHVGDALDVLGTLPDESVHCVVTSPPYWGLRDYGTEGQLGLEPTPDEYVTSMVAVFREVRRVLRRDGTCWLNIGDSYNANQGAGFNAHEYTRPHLSGDGVGQKRIDEANRNTTRKRPAGIKPKDLVGIPWRLAFALQADGWYLRSDIIWSKPNPMPESVTDRPTKAHEYLFLLTRSPRYFYDADSIREPANYERWGHQNGAGKYADAPSPAKFIKSLSKEEITAKFGNQRNKRSVWEIATEPYPDAHFATFPQALVEPCVLAGTSERGCCPVCGAPWERETEASYDAKGRTTNGPRSTERRHETAGFGQRLEKRVETTGWRLPCECLEEVERSVGSELGPPVPRFVPCTVLDPFMGSGTVAVVARRLGRRAVGIELNPEYAKLAATRLQQLSLLAA